MNLEKVYILEDRAILYINGSDSDKYLQNLISNDIGKVNESKSCFASLLTPQGKFLFDFIVVKHKDGYFLDCEKRVVDQLYKKLIMYKLRSKVEIFNLSNEFVVAAFSYDKLLSMKGAKDELKYINTLAKAMRESTIKHLKSLNEGSMDWEKDFPWANEKELKVISKFINMNKRGIDGVLKMQKKDYKGFVRTVQKMTKLLPLMEIMEGKYNYKDDAMTAYMKGKISAQELDKIAKNDFKSSVATKKELQNFLNSGYMKELMANTYGLKVPAMEKKVKELMKYAS